MNDSKALAEFNVRSEQYFVARTRAICRYCKERTELFALALPPGHETLDVAEAAEDPIAADAWILSAHPALLFHIERVTASVEVRLASLTRSFRVDQRNSLAAPAWANHCEACGAWLNDEELFCEPGEAFCPVTEAGAAAIRLLRADDALEAAAGGYSFDPNFFHVMTRE